MSNPGGKVFWLISAPNSNEDVFRVQQAKTESLAKNHKLPIPDLRVGTLDVLMSLSDDLYKFDAFVESCVRKIARQLHDLSDPSENNTRMFSVNDANVEHYLTHFHWDDAKYGKSKPLRELVETITQTITRMEEDLRVKSTEFNNLTHTIAANERKAGGNLSIRSVDDIVRDKRESIVATEYLTTLLIVVNKYNIKDWFSTYESLHGFIVPRSSTVLHDDGEFVLVNMVVFKKYLEDIKTKVREKRYIIKEYQMNIEPGKSEQEEKQRMEHEREHQKKRLILWCKTNFSEAFVAWIHLKAIRTFVESVLRYGLPPNFTAILVEPNKKSLEKKLLESLTNIYKNLAAPHLQFNDTEEGGEKFYPFVYLTVSLEFLNP
eukprot:TRINITY_DN79_c0_g1_i2.p1 TRINITY_DN79_c0_g1~~TRINITY_DN79_c0_g1_i2.p1  ORF type:complete len:376 (+),score=99.36 TRINITY_DN79_c0_g1_i2:84-1211(+)